MEKILCKIILADDDADDCMFFREAVQELPVDATVVTIQNGVELIEKLADPSNEIPDILFLDLNMPRKSGFECLAEIKQLNRLEEMLIIIYSTSLDQPTAASLRNKGANYYIRKPELFSDLRSVIQKALTIAQQRKTSVNMEDFVIRP
jgi:CheY-like chemotaxis protein